MAQQNALAAVLDEVGWVTRVIVNQNTGVVVDGHLRVTLALRRGEPTVPVDYVDLTPAEEALVLATLDPISALAATDQSQLRALLEDVTISSTAIGDLLSRIVPPSGPLHLGYGDGAENEAPSELQLPTSAIRMVQLFLTVETWPIFMENVAALRAVWGTDNLSDTVERAVREALV